MVGGCCLGNQQALHSPSHSSLHASSNASSGEQSGGMAGGLLYFPFQTFPPTLTQGCSPALLKSERGTQVLGVSTAPLCPSVHEGMWGALLSFTMTSLGMRCGKRTWFAPPVPVEAARSWSPSLTSTPPHDDPTVAIDVCSLWQKPGGFLCTWGCAPCVLLGGSCGQISYGSARCVPCLPCCSLCCSGGHLRECECVLTAADRAVCQGLAFLHRDHAASLRQQPLGVPLACKLAVLRVEGRG